MKAELCKTCIHTKVCFHDKNLVGDTFVRGFFDLDDAWEKFKEWAKAGFPCDDYIPAADVVEVVRCKECVMWDGSFTLNGQKKCLNMTFCTDGDFYCGWGCKD